jgi:hypothetical protein
MPRATRTFSSDTSSRRPESSAYRSSTGSVCPHPTRPWMILAGAGPKSVQGQMRHSRVSTTMRSMLRSFLPDSDGRSSNFLSSAPHAFLFSHLLRSEAKTKSIFWNVFGTCGASAVCLNKTFQEEQQHASYRAKWRELASHTSRTLGALVVGIPAMEPQDCTAGLKGRKVANFFRRPRCDAAKVIGRF